MVIYPRILFTFLSILILTNVANGDTIKLAFDKPTVEKLTLIVISDTGTTKIASIKSGSNKIRFAANATPSQVFIRKVDGSTVIVAAKKCDTNGQHCSTKKVAPFFVKGNFRIAGVNTISSTDLSSDQTTTSGISTSRVILASLIQANKYKQGVNSKIIYTRSTLNQNVEAKGQRSTTTASTKALIGTKALRIDKDGDGLPDPLDVDNDGDGILDNYDSDASDRATNASSFSIFSNFKSNIESSINYYTTGLSTAQIDALMPVIQTLAIEVKGTPSKITELDCGSLGYCSFGGTGKALSNNALFPGAPGGVNDADGDGLGEITKGNTGDFQLSTGATSSSIHQGDTIIQDVTSSKGTTTYAGTLNFVFVSNPAIVNYSVNEGPVETIGYGDPANIVGDSNHCIPVSATDPISLRIFGYRPQRLGNEAAGETEYVDIGNSLLSIDIPNGPCSGNHCNGGNGPGNCIASAYSTTDSNLAASPNGLQDLKPDAAPNILNTFAFTIDLTSCLNNASISWTSGQRLYFDLQFRSNYGDNAAQKICIARS